MDMYIQYCYYFFMIEKWNNAFYQLFGFKVTFGYLDFECLVFLCLPFYKLIDGPLTDILCLVLY